MSSLSHVLTRLNMHFDHKLKDQPVSFQGVYHLEEGRATSYANAKYVQIVTYDGQISFIPKVRIESIGGKNEQE